MDYILFPHWIPIQNNRYMEKKEDKNVLKVGIVGLGKMGLQIAKKLAKAGFEVFGFDSYAVCKGEFL